MISGPSLSAILVVIARQAAIAGPGKRDRQQNDDQDSSQNVSLKI